MLCYRYEDDDRPEKKEKKNKTHKLPGKTSLQYNKSHNENRGLRIMDWPRLAVVTDDEWSVRKRMRSDFWRFSALAA